MYDGYHIGKIDIFNPWSIINYAKREELIAYWVNTSSNSMIKKAMEHNELSSKAGYETLIKQGYMEIQVNMETSFYEQLNTTSLWGLFINAGYLTIDKKIMRPNIFRLRIPNREVQEEFQSLTAKYLNVDESSMNILFYQLVSKKKNEFYKIYQSLLLQFPSYHDLRDENSYQPSRRSSSVMMLGMCAYLQRDYNIASNKEVGKGRADIILQAKKDFLSSYVIEFKYMDADNYQKHPGSSKILAHTAIKQIADLKYDCELNGEIIYIGLAHAGKDVEMVWYDKNQNT